MTAKLMETYLLKGRKHSRNSGNENRSYASPCETLFDNLEIVGFTVRSGSSFLKAREDIFLLREIFSFKFQIFC